MENQITPLTFSEKNTASKFSDIKAGHAAIRTTEYDAIIKWYLEKLDFRIVREWTAGEMRLAYLALPNDDDFMVEILGGKSDGEMTNEEVKSGYDHLCFNVADLDETIAELKSRDITITRSFSVPAIGKRVAFIADPFGNKIEFCDNIK